MRSITQCNICGIESDPFGEARVLRKYDVLFFKCPRCSYIHTPEPFWLEEAYALDQSTDVGMVMRNVVSARIAKAVIGAFFDGSGKFLDFGGGPGLFVRLMRDNGFDFYWYDPSSENLFARGLAAGTNSVAKYEAITAFEVFEHFTAPMTSVAEMFNVSESILFSTAIVPAIDCDLDRWWYYALDQGQHVSFYTVESLRILARAFGAKLYTDGNSFHLMTKRKIIPWVFSLLSKPRLATLVDIAWRRRSLTMDDYARALGDLGR